MLVFFFFLNIVDLFWNLKVVINLGNLIKFSSFESLGCRVVSWVALGVDCILPASFSFGHVFR